MSFSFNLDVDTHGHIRLQDNLLKLLLYFLRILNRSQYVLLYLKMLFVKLKAAMKHPVSYILNRKFANTFRLFLSTKLDLRVQAALSICDRYIPPNL